MRDRVLLFTILIASLVALVFTGYAEARLRTAAPGTSPFRRQGELVVPAGWSGVWSDVDSTYDCNGELLGTDWGLDTLCTGTVTEGRGKGCDLFPVDCDAHHDTCHAHLERTDQVLFDAGRPDHLGTREVALLLARDAV